MNLKFTFFFSVLTLNLFAGGGYSDGVEYFYLAALTLLLVLIFIEKIINQTKRLLIYIFEIVSRKIQHYRKINRSKEFITAMG